jgi:pimeloyl-ACP methyl ester carboxylesterase
MEKIKMLDVVVVVPGIMGSVLQKDGQDIWTVDNVLGKAITIPQSEPSFDSLLLTDDSPDVDDLNDGIQATRLVERPLLVPSFGKVGDYQSLKNYLFEYFDLKMGDLQNDEPANYFEFPYDWRRYNSVAARKLGDLIEQKLRLWRHSEEGLPDSKVILIAHSMGGLVCRHYLEVLKGWKNCRLLITLGTPHRGSVNSLERLCNGMKIGWSDLSDLTRSFTSVYELLPIYPLIQSSGKIYRVEELSDLPNIDQRRAKEALAFHRKIEECVKQHQQEISYKDNFEVVPVIGIGQPTLQSAIWSNNKLICKEVVPPNIHPDYQTGDNTVPGFSSIPIELDQKFGVHRKFAARHACIQENMKVLNFIIDLLNELQVKRFQGEPIRGFLNKNPPPTDFPFLSIALEDYYSTEEPIEIRAWATNSKQPIESLVGKINPVYLGSESQTIPFQFEEEIWRLNLPKLDSGLYRLTVEPTPRKRGLPDAIDDYFAVGCEK